MGKLHPAGERMAVNNTSYYISVYYRTYQPFLVYEIKTESKELFQTELTQIFDQYQKLGYKIVTAEVRRQDLEKVLFQEVLNKKGMM
jgi:poly(A) polymerase Pap1